MIKFALQVKAKEVHIRSNVNIIHCYNKIICTYFTGGVSAMNESSELTAIRELTEELGMSRNDALSEPLFRCIVCTSYNRCVVTCFRYIIDDQLDTIKVSACYMFSKLVN